MSDSANPTSIERTDTLVDRLRRRTLTGGVGALLLLVGGYLLGGVPGLIGAGIATVVWMYGYTPLAIAVGTIFVAGGADTGTFSTIFGQSPLTYPTPLFGTVLFAGGIIGFILEPVVTATPSSRRFTGISLLIIVSFGIVLALAHYFNTSIFMSVAVVSGLVLFLAGALNRTIAYQLNSTTNE